jgi:hypothetical protein
MSLAAPAPPRAGPTVPPLDISSYRSSDLDRSGLVFTPLAGTADEAKALQGLLKLDAQMVLTGANATEEKLKGASRSAHSACGQPRVLPERPAGGGRGPPAGQLQRRDTDPCRWARTRCCVRGPPWPGPTCGALARPTMAFSSRPTPRGLIRAAHNWWCSRLRDRTGAGATWRGAVRASPRAGARKRHMRNLSPSRRPMARRRR